MVLSGGSRQEKEQHMEICVDYRGLNAATIKDSHPLPRVDDSLDALAGAIWFSTLDFLDGYWQVEVAPEDREKTAFTTGQGLYQFRSMPMGLTNAPATFQRVMELVLKGLPWHICMAYLDDVLIYSRSFENHLLALGEVFSRIGAAGLRLNARKCHLTRDHVVFLSHVVSAEELRLDPKNTGKVRPWHMACATVCYRGACLSGALLVLQEIREEFCPVGRPPQSPHRKGRPVSMDHRLPGSVQVPAGSSLC